MLMNFISRYKMDVHTVYAKSFVHCLIKEIDLYYNNYVGSNNLS